MSSSYGVAVKLAHASPSTDMQVKLIVDRPKVAKPGLGLAEREKSDSIVPPSTSARWYASGNDWECVGSNATQGDATSRQCGDTGECERHHAACSLIEDTSSCQPSEN